MSSPVKRESHFEEWPTTPRSQRNYDLPSTPQSRISDVAAPLISPSSFISPCEYHSAKYVDENLNEKGEPNRKLRRFSKSLEGKDYHSIVLGSAQKDPRRIREKRIQPDGNGVIEIASESSGSLRRWKAHEPNSNGQRRLFPIDSAEDDKILKLEGSEVHELISSYSKEEDATFEEFIIRSRKRKRECESGNNIE